MCGLVGIISFRSRAATPRLLLSMRDRMVHRGPDDCGAVCLQIRPNPGPSRSEPLFFRGLEDASVRGLADTNFAVALGHRRLSIIDLSSAARQPLCNEDSTIWIVFNGEIYNYAGLRRELIGLGHQFKSRSDTEVILHAYEQWGPSCLERFIGMFAFAIWDARNSHLFLARDRVGKKPLYYMWSGDTLFFASEIKAFLECPSFRPEVNEEGLYHYLSLHCVPAPQTLFKSVHKLQPATCLVIRGKDDIRSECYWNVFARRNADSIQRGQEDLCAELKDLFYDATRLRMISDVPFGAFLSGGIDSSINVAVMSKLLPQPVNTFSIGFSGAPALDERGYAREVAARYGCNHHEIEISAHDALDFLQNLVYIQDEAIADNTCIPTYFLSRLAKAAGVTVCQVGEGSDELFCGYPLWMEALTDAHRAAGAFGRMRALAALGISTVSSHCVNRGWGVFDRSLSLIKQGYDFWGGAVHFRDHEKRSLLSPSFKRRSFEWTADLIASHRKRFHGLCHAPDELAWMTYLDLQIRLPELLLMKLDKFNMAASVEGRVPFLDQRLIEFAMSLPENAKLGPFEPKYLLKQALGHLLPEKVLLRPKQGFQLPVHEWYSDSFRAPFMDLLQRHLLATDVFDDRAVRSHISRRGVPWILLNYALWHRVWVENDMPDWMTQSRSQISPNPDGFIAASG